MADEERGAAAAEGEADAYTAASTDDATAAAPVGRRARVERGTLYVVATPIGNLEDITYRAVRVLREVQLIAAEDTRTARVLLQRYGISTPTVSCFRENEERRGAELVERLREGAAVALIAEAGTPGVSDPGARLVARCLAAGLPVDVIPGPSACLTALLLAGLPSDRFLFVGFLPRKGRERRAALETLAGERGTSVIYEAPPRVGRTLADLVAALGGDRPAALVREATKLHQEVVRATLEDLAARYATTPPRGEVTLVVGGAAPPAAVDEGTLATQVRERLAAGQGPGEIARALGASGRRRVYQLALALARDLAVPSASAAQPLAEMVPDLRGTAVRQRRR